MVLPLLPIALALTAGGLGANYVGNQQAQKAQADVMAAKRTRDRKLDEKGFEVNERAKNRYEDFEEQQGDKKADLAELLTKRPESEEPDLGLPQSGSNITVSNAAKETAEAKKYTDQQGGAKAELMSLGTLFGDINRAGIGDANDLGQVQSERRGWNNLLPTELDAAAQKGSGWRLAGDIAGGLGSIATMGALSGASLPTLGSLSGLFKGGAAAGAAAGPMARPAGLMSLYG